MPVRFSLHDDVQRWIEMQLLMSTEDCVVAEELLQPTRIAHTLAIIHHEVRLIERTDSHEAEKTSRQRQSEQRTNTEKNPRRTKEKRRVVHRAELPDRLNFLSHRLETQSEQVGAFHRRTIFIGMNHLDRRTNQPEEQNTIRDSTLIHAFISRDQVDTTTRTATFSVTNSSWSPHMFLSLSLPFMTVL